jgi:serine phosphatase RsbU (regulator of sigma subunit)
VTSHSGFGSAFSLNDELLEQNPRGIFVTLQFMLFDFVQRRVICASARHHAAVRIQSDDITVLAVRYAGQ